MTDSPKWSPTLKAIVAAVVLVLAGLVIWRFQSLIGPLVLAVMLAYILNPLIGLMTQYTRLKRGAAVLIIYFGLLLIWLGGATVLVLVAVDQIQTLADVVPGQFARAVALVQSLPDLLPFQTITLGPYTLELSSLLAGLNINWQDLVNQAIGVVQSLFSTGGGLATQLAGATVSAIGLGFLIFVVSIYIAMDIPRYGGLIGDIATQPGYRADAERLTRETSRIWSAYLRGQVILGLVIGVVVSIALGLLGVRNALGLGLLSGVMEFLPVIGPLIGVGTAVLVAFFQDAPSFGLSSLNFALVVIAVMLLIQQVENNVLVPRIVGDALDLHPLVVMISVIMGASLAGILGAILAAPVVATLKLLGIYTWRKMLDLPPFPEEEAADPPPGPKLNVRLRRAWRRFLVAVNRAVPDYGRKKKMSEE